ncbi:MAG: translation elongation factor Ts, partial [Actinomycetota bacterium]|nr:translation elongation factor Ts [Actinomycetota bacterium]
TKVKERGAERTAANGLVAAAEGAMIMLNSETDFVAKNEQFQQLATDIVAHAAATKTRDVEALLRETLADGQTVEQNIASLAAVIGEKLQLGRVAVFEGQVATYVHRRASDLPPAVGVLVEYEGGSLDVARTAAMQVCAMRPLYVARDEVPAEVVAKEREIAEATAREEGKPEQALARIVEGRLGGFFKEVVLLEQPAVTESKSTVQKVLADAGVTVTRFARFEVGEA